MTVIRTRIKPKITTNMGNKIGKISPIKRQIDTSFGESTASSLAAKGYTMIPGTFYSITPYKERNGEYRTGLNPEALYIKKMSPEEQTQEIKRVTELKEDLESITGLDLSPRSEYYTKMFEPGEFGDTSRASYVKLIDGPNTFNLADPHSAIQFAWLRVHPDIAPTYMDWKRGKSTTRCPMISQCRFFVDDIEYESDVVYKQKSLINKAINLLETMTPTRQLKVAKLLGLPVAYNTKSEMIYNELDSYIKATNSGEMDKHTNVANFNSIASMTDENIEVRFKVKEAKDFSIYRTMKHGHIYEGETKVADDEEELIEFLSSAKNQDEYLALQKKIDTAKIIEV